MSTSQDHRMRQLLAELELTSNAPAGNYNPSGGHTPSSSRDPSGDSHPPHLRHRDRYHQATNDHQRENAIEAATAELHHIRHTAPATRATESVQDRDHRVREEGEGWEAQIAANHFRISVQDVWRIRKADRRDKDYGLPLPGTEQERLTQLARRRRVHELKRANPGMTARQIALHVGADHKTVVADLQDAA